MEVPRIMKDPFTWIANRRRVCGPRAEKKIITSRYPTVPPVSPKRPEQLGELSDHTTYFNDLSGDQSGSWHNSPQSKPLVLEDQPMTLIKDLSCIGFPHPAHDGSTIYRMNPPAKRLRTRRGNAAAAIQSDPLR